MSTGHLNVPATRVAEHRVVVTGAAGFIGSTVVEQLLALGAEVVGIDDFDPWYLPARKRANLAIASFHERFSLVEADAFDVIGDVLRPDDLVIHLAGRPGVQDSWGLGFTDYSRRNIELTQRVYEEALGVGANRVVYASSSSLYGGSSVGDDRRAAPISPYGVSKLAGEHLANVYAERGLDIVSLRYFTVYGPRQRPDMAMHRMFEATKANESVFVRRGDGLQRREFTFVRDVAEATILSTVAPAAAGTSLDIGGGESASLLDAMALVEEISGPMRTETLPAPAGDPRVTKADLQPTIDVLGWVPTTSLFDGLSAQASWHATQSDYDAVVERS
ncbi:MAG: NAD-dependent epimerase/dehydratase family protein [Actinomycetota bacterium]|nr:NAD-dependent epimerase/dehydratase family protein [Actinomycetota bacterium]